MKKPIAKLLIAMLLVCTLGGYVCADTASAAASACILRVKLSAIGSVKTIPFVPNGQYVTPDGQVLKKGQTYTVYIDGGNIALKLGSTKVYSTTDGYFTLLKTDAGYTGLEINTSKYGSCNYLGDMVFAKSGSYVIAINHVDMETYLVGVVSGEIGESSALEAIKAQAVAARTYAYSAIKSSTAPTTYDIGDTSSNQVYKGYRTTWKRCIKAVQATAGLIITYNNGKIAGGWYASSNGGQTRTTTNAWGSAAMPYLAVSDDIYDYNSTGRKTSLYLPKSITNKTLYATLDYRVQQIMMTELKIALYQQGYSTDDANIKLLGVDDFQMHTQRFAYDANSKSYIYARVAIRLNAYKSDQDTENATGKTKAEFMRVGNIARTTGLYDGPSTSYELLESIWFGARVEVLDKSSKFYKVKTAGGKIGYMNSAYLLDSQTIYTDTGKLPVVDPIVDPTETPTETSTQETEIPTTAPTNTVSTQAQKQYGTVINVNVAVNMRAGAGTNYALVGTVAKGTEVEVLSVANGWANVRLTNGTTGYISMGYLNIYYRDDDNEEPEEDEEGFVKREEITVSVDLFIDDIRMFSLANGASLNGYLMFYAEEYADYYILSMRGNGHGVGMSQRAARTRAEAGHTYDQIISFYFPTSVLSNAVYQVTNPNEPTTEDPSLWYGTIKMDDVMSAVNVRASATTDSTVLGKLTHGTRVQILEKLGDWYKVVTRFGTGYVYGQYILDDKGTTPGTSETPGTPGPSETTPGYTEIITAQVINTSALNVRKGPGSTYDRVAVLYPGVTVTVIDTDLATGWHKVRFADGTEGWASNKYLEITVTQVPEPGVSETPTTTPTEVPTATPTKKPTPTPTEKPTETPTTPGYTEIKTAQVVKTSALNVRTGPGSTYARVAILYPGVTVTVIDTDPATGWHKVRFADGTEGWASNKYLEITVTKEPVPGGSETPTQKPTATPTEKPTNTPTQKPTATPTTPVVGQKGTVVNCNVSVNMRSGAGTNYTIIGTVAKGTVVDVLDTVGNWYYVQLPNGTKGYIINGYLKVTGVAVTNSPTQAPTNTPTQKPTSTPTQKPTVTPTATPGASSQSGTIVNCSYSVNVRSGAGTNHAIIGTAAKGSAVTVLGTSGQWYKVQLGSGTIGYISSEYVQLNSLTGQMYGTSSLNVRSGPNTSYSRVAILALNEKVTILSTADNGWYYVRTASGVEGYASNKYIRII